MAIVAMPILLVTSYVLYDRCELPSSSPIIYEKTNLSDSGSWRGKETAGEAWLDIG